MKFLFVLTNLAGGGAEKTILKLSRALIERGHETQIVLLEERIDHPVPVGVSIHILERCLSHGWLGKRRLAWRLQRLLAGQRHDLLVSTLPFADEVAILARQSRHVCRIANTLSAEISRLPSKKAARRLARYRAIYAGRPLVAVSQGVADDLRATFAIPAQRIRVIPNPFDFAAIRALAAEPCAGPLPSRYLLHVGRFAAQKRHDLLFAAFATMVREGAPHHLVLLTPADPLLAKLIAHHGLQDRVIVAGFQSNPYPWMANADLLVLCSDHEGLPNVLIEALACGTRVVSTDCPSGPREILRGELARGLVPCGDAAALAQAMRDALALPKPTATAVEAALAPYDSACALDAWEALARGIA